MDKVTMKEIRKAWRDAVDALSNHDHKTRPPEMEEFFMIELNKLGYNMSDIITSTYCAYVVVGGQKEELNAEIEQITGKLEQKSKVCNKYVDQIEMILAKRNVLDNTIESMGKTIEDLESSLVTARYYIFLGSMCGFLLGLACLFLVV
jgi:hypothetical protein